MKHGESMQATVEMYIRALPGSPFLKAGDWSEELDELRRVAAGKCFGDELMAPPWNGNWAHRASLEKGGFSEAEKRRFEFRDGDGRLADPRRYEALCDDIRAFWEIHLLKNYPGLPLKRLRETLRDARFYYSAQYGAVVGAFIHTGLEMYKMPRKPGVLERLFGKKNEYFDKTLVLFIAAFGDLNLHRTLKDVTVQRAILDETLIKVTRAHYLEALRPPVQYNYYYTVLPFPCMTEDEAAVNRFWDEATRQIARPERFKALCGDLRGLVKERMLKEFPDYDRETLEDGLENLQYDYDPEQGALTASMVLPKLMRRDQSGNRD